MNIMGFTTLAGAGRRRWRQRTPAPTWGPGRRLMAMFSALLLVLSFVPAAASTALAQSAPDQPTPQTLQPNGTGTASIEISLHGCAPTTDDAATTQGRSFDELLADCTEPVSGVTVHLTDTQSGADAPQTSGADGIVRYPNLDPGTYTAYTGIQRGTAFEVVYCVADGGDPYQKTFSDAIVTTFEDVETEQITCDWFVVPVAGGTTAASPTAASPTATTAARAASDERGSISVSVLRCPDGTALDPQSGSYADFAQACTAPDEGVTVHFTDTSTDVDAPQTTGADGTISFGNLAPGTYTAYTDIPRGSASEVLFCAADGGDPYQKDFNDAIVTTFRDLQHEQIECSWFVIPAAPTPTAAANATVAPTAVATQPKGVRTAETGGSLTVHLSSCPVDYAGNDIFADCHGDGIADMPFVLSGPNGEQTSTTTVPETPGPGIATFTGLAAGDYTLQGGPGGDFGRVSLVCTLQPSGDPLDAPVEGTQASFTLAAGDDVLCDWYFIPENLSGMTPTPTVSPTPTQATTAEILVTLYSCPAPTGDSRYGGATYGDLQQNCTQPVNDVPFTLGDVNAPPLSANTGVSGDGAVRFFDLLPADYTLTPSLPSNLTSTAVFCTIGSGDPYQKALQNGAVTFVDVDGESISCDWYAVESAPPAPTPAPGVTPASVTPQGPTGSITVREYLCEKSKESIKDWERECTAGTSNATFTLKATNGSLEQHGSTNSSGVLVFKGLADGHYALNQDEGSWCRATADRVDSQSRVIVSNGGNTDVVLYQCDQVSQLPNTGSGTPVSRSNGGGKFSAMVVVSIVLAITAAGLGVYTFVRSRRPRRRPVDHREMVEGPLVTSSGRTWMRFK